MTKNESRWEISRMDLGEISPKRRSVYFKSIVPLDDVSHVSASCGCSVPKVDHDRIRVDYSPAPVPYHLRERGYYETAKKITVHYKDGTSDDLVFSAKVVDG